MSRKRVPVEFASAPPPVAFQRPEKGVAHASLLFEAEPMTDIDEADRRKAIAMRMQAIDRASRPWCPECNVHKVGRVGKGLDAPLDNLCGICSKVSADHGPRKILEYHDKYCGSCQKKKTGEKDGKP